MDRPFICVGDRIDHGGSVVSGSPFTDVDGKPVSRINDRVVCERHGPTVIVTGDSTMIIDGQPVARDGDKTACGATLISSQIMAFTGAGSSGGARRQGTGAVTAAAAAVAATAASPTPEFVAESPLGFDGRDEKDPGDPQKARDAVRDANAALREAGAYRPYETEIEAARTWREHVLPVADDHQVEIGAIISQTPDGMYHLGPAYSKGAYDNVTGLVENGQYTEGTWTAFIHTHPKPGGWVGSDRELKHGDQLQWVTMSDGGRELIGGITRSQDYKGDLVSAYHEQVNTYICDSAGLHGWNYKEYVEMQRRQVGGARLGEAYREGL